MDQQDVVIGMSGRYHLGPGREEGRGSIDLLTPGVLMGGSVGSGPEAVWSAGRATVQVAPEDDGSGGRAASEEGSEFRALGCVRGDLVGFRGGQMSGAYVDPAPGADA